MLSFFSFTTNCSLSFFRIYLYAFFLSLFLPFFIFNLSYILSSFDLYVLILPFSLIFLIPRLFIHRSVFSLSLNNFIYFHPYVLISFYIFHLVVASSAFVILFRIYSTSFAIYPFRPPLSLINFIHCTTFYSALLLIILCAPPFRSYFCLFLRRFKTYSINSNVISPELPPFSEDNFSVCHSHRYHSYHNSLLLDKHVSIESENSINQEHKPGFINIIKLGLRRFDNSHQR